MMHPHPHQHEPQEVAQMAETRSIFSFLKGACVCGVSVCVSECVCVCVCVCVSKREQQQSSQKLNSQYIRKKSASSANHINAIAQKQKKNTYREQLHSMPQSR